MCENKVLPSDYQRQTENLKLSLNAKNNFDKLIAALGSNHPFHYIWDIPLSSDDFWITPFLSPDNRLLTGLVRYRNCLDLNSEPTPGAAFNKIPEILRNRKQWIWLESIKNKNDRLTPYLCRGVKESEGLLPKNWMAFHPADWTSGNGFCGNGYVLNDDLIVDNLRLVAIEIGPQSGLNNHDIKNLWITLGKPYLEYSKDCHGWTILGLINRQLTTINRSGVKIFTAGDFVELSGLGAEGKLVDISEEISALHALRFPETQINKKVNRRIPKTPRELAKLNEMLSFISADCNYDVYMRVVWGIMSTGWPDAAQIALDWSMTAKHRFDQNTFDNLIKSYDPDRSNTTTMGSIFYLAKLGGWHG